MFCNSNACNAKRIPWSPPVKVEVRPKGDGDGGKFGGGGFDDNHVRKGGKKSKKSAPKIRQEFELLCDLKKSAYF